MEPRHTYVLNRNCQVEGPFERDSNNETLHMFRIIFNKGTRESGVGLADHMAGPMTAASAAAAAAAATTAAVAASTAPSEGKATATHSSASSGGKPGKHKDKDAMQPHASSTAGANSVQASARPSVIDPAPAGSRASYAPAAHATTAATVAGASAGAAAAAHTLTLPAGSGAPSFPRVASTLSNFSERSALDPDPDADADLSANSAAPAAGAAGKAAGSGGKSSKSSVLELGVATAEDAYRWINAIKACIQSMQVAPAAIQAGLAAAAPGNAISSTSIDSNTLPPAVGAALPRAADYGSSVPDPFKRFVELRSHEMPLQSSNLVIDRVIDGLTIYREVTERDRDLSAAVLSLNTYWLGAVVALILAFLMFFLPPFGLWFRVPLTSIITAGSIYLTIRAFRNVTRPGVPTYTAGVDVRGSPKEVCETLISMDKSRFLWDSSSATIKVGCAGR